MSKLKPNTPVTLYYSVLRNVTTPDEAENGATTYSVVMPAEEILKVGTDDNLRDYIPEHNKKQRSMVHRAIASTIRNERDRFSQLNSGFLIGSSKVELDDKNRKITLYDASINNGAQSQGEIRMYFEECAQIGIKPELFFIRAEIGIEPDRSNRIKIAIARNTATKVQDISKAGKQGYFDELDVRFRRDFPNWEIAKSETDIGENLVDPRFLLQILWALIPDELAPKSRQSIDSRIRSYKNAAACLTDFIRVHDKKESDPASKRIYEYFLDMAGTSWELYQHWKTSEVWSSKRLRSDAQQAVRDNHGAIMKVHDGVIFPILAALSQFVKYDKKLKKWSYKQPRVFQDEMMAGAARRQLSAHEGKPMYMGRSSSAYEALKIMTEMASSFES
ncbi:AIPR family protein [Qipengyuania spongiae]|uniref:AIPR family protein n=1 Tax=Qipengyuania spongiae TaxID=2909673 RepID=A0ABY5SVM8_9SPHN|nr:AIPR family protein [Qipengyuania spongiae]UVI38607.1 AIPR family protein [Qipengyuania spongiae]